MYEIGVLPLNYSSTKNNKSLKCFGQLALKSVLLRPLGTAGRPSYSQVDLQGQHSFNLVASILADFGDCFGRSDLRILALCLYSAEVGSFAENLVACFLPAIGGSNQAKRWHAIAQPTLFHESLRPRVIGYG